MTDTKDSVINDEDTVTVYSCGNYKEIVCCKHDVNKINSIRLNKNQYIDKRTQEVKEYNHHEIKSLENFKRQFKKIPRLIKGYFYGDYTERFITLTYSYIMTDPYRLPYDFKKFIRKIERRYGKCRYIYIKEPNEKGSWHIHCILKRMNGMPFNITVETVRKIWEHGYEVDVVIPYNIETLPYYFDISRYEDKKARVVYYPSYMKIYGCSEDMRIVKSRGKYKDLKPKTIECVYKKENQHFSVDYESGEIIAQCKNIYEQYRI